MIGNWMGEYQHSDQRLSQDLLSKRTVFYVQITAFDGTRFSGNIRDDEATGGTRGEGQINGQLKNGNIWFVKSMPIQTLLLPDGTRIEENKPHRKIYYDGTLIDYQFSGTWRFKLGFGKVNGKFSVFLPARGIWHMSKTQS